MAKKFYLVDTENVGSVWVDLIPTLGKQDCLLLFYTVNSSGISYEDLLKLAGQEEKYQMIQCFTGRNGLDFQLVSYLGYLIKSNAKAEFIIISNDSGYDAVVRFWSAKDISVSRVKASVLHRSLQQDADSVEQLQKTGQKAKGKTVAKQADPEEENTPEQKRSAAASAEEQESETEPSGQTESSSRAKSRKRSVVEEKSDKESVVSAQRQNDSQVEPQKQEASAPAKKGRTRTAVKRNRKKEIPDVDFSVWLPEETKGEASKMIEVFQQEKRDEVHKIYLGFVKRFGQEKGVACYRALKPHLNEIYDRL